MISYDLFILITCVFYVIKGLCALLLTGTSWGEPNTINYGAGTLVSGFIAILLGVIFYMW